MKYCSKHGINNPACTCDPLSDTHRYTSIPVPDQDPGMGIPWLDEKATCIAFSVRNLNMAIDLMSLIKMFGYDAVLVTPDEFQAPLQRKPRTDVVLLFTTCSTRAVMLLINYLLIK